MCDKEMSQTTLKGQPTQTSTIYIKETEDMFQYVVYQENVSNGF